jgi:hypothetical protein
MEDLVFEYSQNKTLVMVRLSMPYGAGGDGYHVNINGYHMGVLRFRAGQWECTTDRVSPEDIQRFASIIEGRDYWDKVLN